MPRLPELGLVICYSYLWRDEARTGQEEGLKDRPCVIIGINRREDGFHRVTVVPVTHSPPTNPESAVEIPAAVKRRLGMDDAPSWIVSNETNTFSWPGPDLRPINRDLPGKFDYGFLPNKIFHQVRDQVTKTFRAGRHRTTQRTA